MRMPLFGRPNVARLQAMQDVNGLIQALGYKKDPSVRRAAAKALGNAGGARVVESLVGALRDPDPNVREAATDALDRLVGWPHDEAAAGAALPSSVAGPLPDSRPAVAPGESPAPGPLPDPRPAVHALPAKCSLNRFSIADLATDPLLFGEQPQGSVEIAPVLLRHDLLGKNVTVNVPTTCAMGGIVRRVFHSGRRHRMSSMGGAAVVLIAVSVTGCAGGSSSPSAGVSNSPAVASASQSSPVPTQSPTTLPTASRTPRPTPAPTYGPLGKFLSTGSMTIGRDSHTATLLLDGRVLIAGGEGYDAARSAELYDPKTGKFSPTGSMAVGHEVATATLLLDGRVLIVGGWEYSDRNHRAESASAALYDPRTGAFAGTGSLKAPRHFQTATRLLDGRVLVAGGEIANDYQGSATAELYDPATGAFSPTGSMTAPRIFHTATLLRDGRVLIAGGNGDSSAELYDPVTATFSQTGSMTIINQDHVATLLSDGRVLVAGEGAELYDPGTGKFSPTGSMINTCNCSGPIGSPGSAPLLPDGRVLVPDLTTDASSNMIGSAELYDPATGTFSQAGPMSRYRFGFTDTLLADGRVLFAGDQGPVFGMAVPSFSKQEAAAIDAERSSAELYVP
jgi:hypothetical protein